MVRYVLTTARKNPYSIKKVSVIVNFLTDINFDELKGYDTHLEPLKFFLSDAKDVYLLLVNENENKYYCYCYSNHLEAFSKQIELMCENLNTDFNHRSKIVKHHFKKEKNSFFFDVLMQTTNHLSYLDIYEGKKTFYDIKDKYIKTKEMQNLLKSIDNVSKFNL